MLQIELPFGNLRAIKDNAMNPELLISVVAAITTIIAAVISLSQVFSKTKAEQKFINTLRSNLDSKQKKAWAERLAELQLATLKHRQISILELEKETAILDPEKLEMYIKRQQQLDELRKEFAQILEKMETLDKQQKVLIAESVNQPSKQGQIAYLDKLIKEIGGTAVLRE